MTGFGAMVSNALKVKPHIYRFSVCSTLVDKCVMSFQAMKHAMPRMCVNLVQNEHAPMDYHAQTIYATNQPNLVKTPPPIVSHRMIHAPQNNVSNLLVGVNSVVVPHWKRGQASMSLALPT